MPDDVYQEWLEKRRAKRTKKPLEHYGPPEPKTMLGAPARAAQKVLESPLVKQAIDVVNYPLKAVNEPARIYLGKAGIDVPEKPLPGKPWEPGGAYRSELTSGLARPVLEGIKEQEWYKGLSPWQQKYVDVAGKVSTIATGLLGDIESDPLVLAPVGAVGLRKGLRIPTKRAQAPSKPRSLPEPTPSKGKVSTPVEKEVTKLSDQPILYHGTTKQFDVFKPTVAKEQQVGVGIHFTDDISFAKRYSGDKGRIIKARLDIKKPWFADELVKIGTPEEQVVRDLAKGQRKVVPYESGGYIVYNIDNVSPQKLQRVLESHGYDGIVYTSDFAEKVGLGYKPRSIQKAKTYVVFKPEQISIVKEAGKPVPKEVLKDYPDLKTKEAKDALRKEKAQAQAEEKVVADRVQSEPTVQKSVTEFSKKEKQMGGFGDELRIRDAINRHDELEGSFEKLKNRWFGRKDWRHRENEIETVHLQRNIKRILGKKKYDQEAKDIDYALQVYIDLKRRPDHLPKYIGKLTPEQQRIVELSQNLPPEIVAVGDEIAEKYAAMGAEAVDEEVLLNLIENYAARIWKQPKAGAEAGRKFGTTTRHKKQRVFDTILEGWASGRELAVKGATNNLKIYRDEMISVIEDRGFLKGLQKLRDIDGNQVITPQHLEGYAGIEHPNFSAWRWVGKVQEGKSYGKNFFITKDGNVLERQRLYAPEKIAKNLNNILGKSRYEGVFIDTVTKYNAVMKHWILQSNLFHHLAFLRSYYFGGDVRRWADMRPINAARRGLQAIEQKHPIIELGVRNGLTFNLIQDWEEHLIRQGTIIDHALEKYGATKAVKDVIGDLRRKHTGFLFNVMGPGYKANTFLLEMKHALKKYPNADPNDLAREAASLVNDDFGGLHLGRLGRDPTHQHIFRLLALAPDWTESNVRTMVKAFKTGREGAMYRRFWARIILKAGGITALLNYIMSGGDMDEMKDNYDTAWREGNMKWMKVDITPIYELTGGESGQRKYFSVFGHFLDPVKFVTHTVRSAKHKSSVVGSIVGEAIEGTDWAGRRFTTIEELLSEGETVKWGGKKRPIDYELFPSYAISQVVGMQPIQVQNFIAWLNGEMEGFDAIGNSMGLGISTTYDLDESRKRTRGTRSRRKK